MEVPSVPRYGVHHQARSETEVEEAAEAIRLRGYAVVDGGYEPHQLAKFSSAFDSALASVHARHGGRDALAAIDEHNTIRALLAYDRLFLDMALNPTVTAVARQLIGNYLLLNQQNGIINPPHGARYNQAAFHRDLPYQHFVSSHPLAINALFCMDAFTEENGATFVVPASHKIEAFPSDAIVRDAQIQVTAKAGSFLLLDCMLFHCGGTNRTATARRAVNHLYTLPFFRQQIDLPAALGCDYSHDPEIRRVLGYDLQTPSDVSSYYATRRAKMLPQAPSEGSATGGHGVSR